MPNTDRWDLSYPTENDQATGWLQLQDLAEDVEAALGKAYVVANDAARTALGVALGVGGAGFTVLQTDTGAPWMWSGTVWLSLAGSGGGGGGGSSGSLGRWAASSAQPIPNNAGTVVGFGTDLAAHADWVKATEGAGHKFVAQRAGRLTGGGTIRYATTTAAGVRDVHVLLNGTEYIGSAGGAIAGQPATHPLSIIPTDIVEDDYITVEAFQATGTTRNLEPGTAGRWVKLGLELR